MFRASVLFAFGASIFAMAFNASHLVARAAEDCGAVRSQIFGTGPSDRQSAQFKYNNLKSALAKTRAKLASDERDLELTRRSQAAYFVQRGKTNAMLEFKLSTDTERVREDRANVQYYMQKLSSAAATLRRLNAQYKRDCQSKPEPTAVPSANTWAGTWDTSFGTTVLDEGGSGTYAFCNGKISGSVRGNQLAGTWKQDWTQSAPCGGALEGTGGLKFTLAADGKSWSGGWHYDSQPNAWRMGWHGTCIAGPCMSNH